MTEQPFAVNRESTATEPVQARTVAAGRGAAWIAESWRLFKQAPLIWIVSLLIMAVILIVLSVVPLANLLVNLVIPVFTAGLILGARELDTGGELQLSHLFAGFSRRSGSLIALGALYLLLMFLTLAITFALMYLMGQNMDVMLAPVMQGQTMDPQTMDAFAMGMAPLLGSLIMMLLLVPVIMLYWFAPAIIILHDDIGVIAAMKLSFDGCMKNVLPFTVYGLLLMLLGIIALIPFALGLLILLPMVIASIYVAYRDIYL